VDVFRSQMRSARKLPLLKIPILENEKVLGWPGINTGMVFGYSYGIRGRVGVENASSRAFVSRYF
jgi:hypothetical protein